MAKRAKEAKVSCWTAEQLAQVVEEAQARHFTATKILKIIESAFTPSEVTAAVNELLAEKGYSDQDFYKAILIALRGLQRAMRGSPRTAEVITARVTTQPGFEEVEVPEVEKALRDLAGASRGAMNFEADGRVVVHTTLDELERRAAALLGERGKPRHAGHFTADAAEEQED